MRYRETDLCVCFHFRIIELPDGCTSITYVSKFENLHTHRIFLRYYSLGDDFSDWIITSGNSMIQ